MEDEIRNGPSGGPRGNRSPPSGLRLSGAGSLGNNPTDWIAVAAKARFAVPEMARLLGRSLRQLERAFDECSGWSPRAWLHHARLWQACALVVHGKSPMAFYDELSFANPSGLYHAFSAYHKCTPQEYLLNHLHARSEGFGRLRREVENLNLRLDGSAPQHIAALSVLNQVLCRSERLTLYYLQAGL